MRTISLLILIVGSATFGTGCKMRRADSKIKLLGGYDAAVDIAPWTVRLNIQGDAGGELCTGTFVSPNTLITAAHCIHGNTTVSIPRYNVSSSKIYKHPTHDTIVDQYGSVIQVNKNDYAVVIFQSAAATAFTELATRAPSIGEEVIFVGYGSCTRWMGADTGTRRCVGSNKVDNLNNNMIHSNAGQGPDGVAVSPGDSGGPLYIDGFKLAGIASGGETGSGSLHTNLILAENIEFLRTAVKDYGAEICGLDNHKCEGAGAGGVDASVVLAKIHGTDPNVKPSPKDGVAGDKSPASGATDTAKDSSKNPSEVSDPTKKIDSKPPTESAAESSNLFYYNGQYYKCPTGQTLGISSSGTLFCQ